jgi:enoyl-CoA hydratase/carnithine racemase
MSYEHILVAHDGPLAIVTMNRPERRNALALPLMHELIDVLGRIAQDSAVRVVIIAGNGPAFSAGHDLREMIGSDESACQNVFTVCTALMLKVQEIPQPVIAKVHGIATAAGCQLVGSCDLAIASDTATFATPGVKIGLFCTTPMVAVTRAIGRKRAFEMLFTGTPIDAHTAADWGLVNRVVPADQLDDTTRALALQIADASPLTVSIGKRAFYRQIDCDVHDAYEYARDVMSQNAIAGDAQEGMSAFIEKRKPVWRGK